MSTQTVIVLVIVLAVVVLLVAAAAVVRKRRSAQLRSEFGPEYDRTIDDAGTRRTAEKDLAARKQEHEQLVLRPLSSAARERYTSAWMQLQARFVDAPAAAVSEADTLVAQLLAERGYPTDGFDQQSRLLSVEHAHVLDSYRSAHETELASRAGHADTEAVRNAMLDFRRVFEEVMGDTDDPYPTASATETDPARDTRGRSRS